MVRIPDDKRFFRIGEVSRIIGVEPYVLRYWESEFPQIRPRRADSNQRTYQKKDLEVILEIKRLLYEEKMTIEGARQRLRKEGGRRTIEKGASLAQIKEELREILRILS
ncbi:MAG: MerR family transcriptional regulator [Deltaproteobacteria bacterium]|nr:MerR family transcriptional regulator [Deltaproteobacteria bacterium]MBW1921959.1 MerR family transcriptional regulator [Deltaproteobacteria bacterium]MBW1948772.1 MerR family transcriptional regulator [Deltaproteobacteria bacterium]MBW2006450.1 MerR family transcriptional regulator [Deltaproteobacteria bacterium]MBW2102725.1 MerR family transcriptional regulator [Deltaproteobacteria bacterium]